MTRYEYAMQQAGDAATENYLRDLKASHEQLETALKLYADHRNWRANMRFDVNSGNFNGIITAALALKAAEAMR